MGGQHWRRFTVTAVSLLFLSAASVTRKKRLNEISGFRKINKTIPVQIFLNWSIADRLLLSSDQTPSRQLANRRKMQLGFRKCWQIPQRNVKEYKICLRDRRQYLTTREGGAESPRVFNRQPGCRNIKKIFSPGFVVFRHEYLSSLNKEIHDNT